MSHSHHYEVIVRVNDDGAIDLPEQNSENSATWWDGTVYASDDDPDGDGSGEGWMHAYDSEGRVPVDEVHAADAMLRKVLEFPALVEQAFIDGTTSDGWDIGIMEAVAELLAGIGLKLPDCQDLIK